MVHRREDDADHRDLGLYRPEPHQSRFGEDRALGLDPHRSDFDAVLVGRRSEEHTSELQSLMRISYAVFCLKKKNTQYKPKTQRLTIQYTILTNTPHNDR